MKPKFEEVGAPFWDDGAPVLVVGTGTSLKGVDLGRLRGLGHVLAVKEAYRDMPFAEACFGLDLPWMERERERLEELAARMPLYLAVPAVDSVTEKAKEVRGAHYLIRHRDGPLILDAARKAVESGGNSGYGAVNFAALKMRAQDRRSGKLMVLFGFDYTSNHYCHDRYPGQAVNHNERYWPAWARNYDVAGPQLAAAGIEVLNASPNSIVKAFKKVTLEEAILGLDRRRLERERGLRSGADDSVPASGLGDPGPRAAAL